MRRTNADVRQEQIDWRRDKVLELAADGRSAREIADILKISHATISRDILLLRAEAKDDIRKYINEQVPFEYKKTLAGLEGIIKYMSSILSDSTKETKEKMQAASIKMQAYNMKMELVAGANLVEDAIDLVDRYRDYTTEKRQVTIDGTSEST